MKIIKPADWQIQPWKNGGGITHELMCEKDNAGILWRLSIAEVAQNGPFSVFPNIDRIILLLRGKGFKLNFGNTDNIKIIDTLYEPFHFSGEQAVECTLLSEPIRDFNLMTRHHRFHPRFQVLNLDIHETYEIPLLAPSYIFYVAKGSVEIEISNSNNTHVLMQEYTLLVDRSADSLRLLSNNASAIIFIIALNTVIP